MTRAGALAVLVLGASCTTFEDPDVVLDLRVLAMTATMPEQVIDVDLQDPAQPTELLAQLVPVEVCALVADHTRARRLRYELTLCEAGSRGRCGGVQVVLATGLLDDPDTTQPAPRLCATVPVNGNLLGVLLATLDGDPLFGLGGLDYLAELRVGGELEDPAADEYASKTLRVSPRIPAARLANVNPTLDRIDASVAGGEPTALAAGRCVDQLAPLEVAPGTELRLEPIEPDTAREAYVVPTIDGNSAMFTESLTYQWIATAGSFTSGSTGGPRDISGNAAPLFTEWRAPRAEDVDAPIDVGLWIVQRDERLGASWHERCVRVVP